MSAWVRTLQQRLPSNLSRQSTKYTGFGGFKRRQFTSLVTQHYSASPRWPQHHSEFDAGKCNKCRPCSSESGGKDSNKTTTASASENTTSMTSTTGDTPDEIQIPGSQAGGKKLAIVYTCKVCDTRSIKQFSEHSYQNGVVLVRCPGCQNLHLIADRLGIFAEGGDWDIQSALAKLGENVNVVNNDNVLELSLEDLVGSEKLEKVIDNRFDDDDSTTGNTDNNGKTS